MKYQYDIISIGDATLDTFLMLDEANVLCNINKDECWLCLNYASKIPVRSIFRTIAGNAANNAVGSARLGLKTAFYTVVGDDHTGELLTKTLKKEKVHSNYVQVSKGQASNYSVVLNYKEERTILVYHEKRKYKLPKLAPSKWIYVTSMGVGSESVTPDLVNYIKKTGCKVGFNPGTHQLKSGVKVLQPILKLTTVLIVNKEEARLLTNTPGNDGGAEDVKDLMKKLWAMGPQTVVVTDGPNGSYSFNGKIYHYIGIFPVPILQRTGAGDAFSTGFMAAMFYGKDSHEALRWGTFNSASVIQKMGPQAGLLHKNEMLKFLRENKKFICKTI
ncbi:carbohydrate kinase family protein [Candidatus Uhrbacteria bacterium]|nr:carbohydrate kinase family protein [Candidatus Uhrbacteria bacterium]